MEAHEIREPGEMARRTKGLDDLKRSPHWQPARPSAQASYPERPCWAEFRAFDDFADTAILRVDPVQLRFDAG